ncbi:MAG: hypothetical protein ACRDAO_05730 [Culicoidibacterales bacterium]
MNYVIICEGGPTLGMGHIVRMQRLASTRKQHVTFVVRTYALPADSHFGTQWLRSQGYHVLETTFDQCQRVVQQLQPSRIIIDTYNWQGYSLHQLAQIAPITIFDDDATIEAESYSGNVATYVSLLSKKSRERIQLIQAGCFVVPKQVEDVRVFSGLSYCLLADEYKHIPDLSEKKHLLVTFGSTDPHNMTAVVAQWLAVTNIPTTIVIGPAFAKDVQWYTQRYGTDTLQFISAVPTLYHELAKVTHVLCSASTTVYEVFATQRCLAAFVTVDNQRGIARALQHKQLAPVLGSYNQLNQGKFYTQLDRFWKSGIKQITKQLNPSLANERCWKIIEQ